MRAAHGPFKLIYLRLSSTHMHRVPSFSKYTPASLFHYHVTALGFYEFPTEPAIGVNGKARLRISAVSLVGLLCYG